MRDYDPELAREGLVSYSVDDAGNIVDPNADMETITVTGTPTGPIWPLLAILGVIGYALFWGGQRTK